MKKGTNKQKLQMMREGGHFLPYSLIITNHHIELFGLASPLVHSVCSMCFNLIVQGCEPTSNKLGTYIIFEFGYLQAEDQNVCATLDYHTQNVNLIIHRQIKSYFNGRHFAVVFSKMWNNKTVVSSEVSNKIHHKSYGWEKWNKRINCQKCKVFGILKRFSISEMT